MKISLTRKFHCRFIFFLEYKIKAKKERKLVRRLIAR